MPESAGFRFGPRDRRGLIAGIRTGQAVVVTLALLGALAGLYVLKGSARSLAALMVLFGALVAFLPVGGRTLEEWVPVAARFSSAGARGARHEAPAIEARGPRPPSVLAGFKVLELEIGDARSIGAVHDQRRGVLAAALVADGGPFPLRDRAERGRLVAAWSSVLAAAAHGSAPYRLQWIVRTVPDGAEELRERLVTGFAGAAPNSARQRAQESYETLVRDEHASAVRHEILLVLAVRAPASPGRLGPAAARLGREVLAFERRLKEAGVAVGGPATPAGLRAMLRRAFDTAPVLGDVAWPWPVALEESWSTLRTDGTWHASYWIAEWPRHEVDSDFLLPLILNASDRRAISVVMSPVPPARAMRQVEHARTSVVADGELRRRHGFALTARSQREQQAVLRREVELAEGHAAYRFSGYVTVSSSSPEGLDEACARVEQAGAIARLELRRLYGAQGEAFCCTLPVARGCN